MVGIDQAGSFSVIAMLPSKDATPERMQELSAAMFTFQRADTADDASQLAAVEAKAHEIAKAFLNHDYEMIADATYPKVIEIMGGREAVVARMYAELEKFKEIGLTCHEYIISKPTHIARDGEKVFIVIPTSMKMSVPNAKVTTNSYLLAISSDSGQTWTFLNGSKLDNKRLVDKILPGLPKELVLPEKREPEIVENLR